MSETVADSELNHRVYQLTVLRLQYSFSSPSSPDLIMSILLSDRQTDDLYVSQVPTWPAYLLISIKPSYRHKAILDYLQNAGFTKSFEQLKEDTKLVRPI